MKVLVTGATGFVGKAIVRELKSKGFNIYTCGKSPISADNADNADSVSAGLPNYVPVDIASKESVKRLRDKIGQIDRIIHSAGLAHQFQAPKDEKAFEKVNVDGTRNIAEAAAALGCKKFVHISSISVYGADKPNPCGEDAARDPNGSYAVSKNKAEKAVTEVCEANNIELRILRLATVYGEGDVGNILRLIKLIDSGKFFWTGKGDNCKSLIHNSDAARACAIALEKTALEKTAPGAGVFNVTGQPHTMREIVETIAENLGRKIPSISVPPGLIGGMLKIAGLLPVAGPRARSLSESLKKWRSDDVLSGEKIKTELGFEPEVTLADGIKKEIEWYRKNIK
jgi:nucleoside-diphosphate-sugar epimerase